MKRANEQVQVQVGAFLALGVLLFMTAVFLLGSKSSMFQSYIEYECHLLDASGVRVGTPIHLAGVSVGYVDDLSFYETEDVYQTIKIKLNLKVKSEFQHMIREDSSAGLMTQGLLGDSVLLLTAGSREAKELGQGEKIQIVRESLGIEKLIERGNQMALTTTKILDKVQKVVTNVDDISSTIKNGKGVVHQLIYSPEDAQALSEVLGQSNVASKAVAKTFLNLEDVTQKINTGQGTLGLLVNDPSAYEDLRTLLGRASRNKLIKSLVQYTLTTKENQPLIYKNVKSTIK